MDFQVDLLLVGVPKLLGRLGLLWNIGLLGVLNEVWVVFPSPDRGEKRSG